MAIEVNKLSKTYGNLKAVDAVELAIEEGTVFGLLGPNGAGKTTLISMMVTMRKPSSGSATVNGFDISKDPASVRKSIGIVFQDQSLDEELTASENLDIHAALYGVPRKERSQRIKDAAKIVGLQNRLHALVKTFSGGMKRRLEIARGLIHHPKILFLDEPTLGLDPQTRASIWEHIKKINREEKITIILTTHYMDEADMVCGKVAIIDNGKIIAIGPPEGLKNGLGGDVVSVKCSNESSCTGLLSRSGWVKAVVKHNGTVDVMVENGEEKTPKIIRLLERQGIEVESVSLRKPSLDDVFLHYTGRTIREEEANPKDAFRQRRMAWGHRR